MRGRKICVSVGEKSIDGLKKQVQAIAGRFELIEIRADFLELGRGGSDIGLGVASLVKEFPEQKFVVTFRPEAEGGNQPLTPDDRRSFWESGLEVEFADLEADIAGSDMENHGWKHRILSSHTFRSADPPNPEPIISCAEPGDVIKIAVSTADITDGLEVWKMIERQSAHSRFPGIGVLPVAMGECGKWTRILAPAFGAPFTYASPDNDRRTAPGQISGSDLKDVYRTAELSRDTEIYGIVGNPVSHSVSTYMHNAAFIERGLDAVYLPLQVVDLENFIERMVRHESREINWNLRGFSVTAPHKRKVIEYLDFLDPAAKSIGSVNTVQIVEGKLIGFNTDAKGFIEPLFTAFGDLNNIAVALIGAGGAARACLFALAKAGADVTVFARDRVQRERLSNDFGCPTSTLDDLRGSLDRYQIAVNATPIGTRGVQENATPLTADEIKSFQLVYDLVYNPSRPLFLREAKKAGVPFIGGLEMLIAQGAAQYELWTGAPAPIDKMSRAVRSRLN